MATARILDSFWTCSKRCLTEAYFQKCGYTWPWNPRLGATSAGEAVVRILAFLDSRDDAEGDISDLSPIDIEMIAGWSGEPGFFWDALIRFKWVDDLGSSKRWHHYHQFNSITVARRENGKTGGRPREIDSVRSLRGDYETKPKTKPNTEPTAKQSGSGSGSESGSQVQSRDGGPTPPPPVSCGGGVPGDQVVPGVSPGSSDGGTPTPSTPTPKSEPIDIEFDEKFQRASVWVIDQWKRTVAEVNIRFPDDGRDWTPHERIPEGAIEPLKRIIRNSKSGLDFKDQVLAALECVANNDWWTLKNDKPFNPNLVALFQRSKWEMRVDTGRAILNAPKTPYEKSMDRLDDRIKAYNEAEAERAKMNGHLDTGTQPMNGATS